MKKLVYILLPILLWSCEKVKENETQKIAERFFKTYSERKELEKMVSFYSNVFQYENVNFESDATDVRFLYQELYGWNDKNMVYPGESILVEQILSNDSTIVAKGTTMPYYYNGKEVNGTRFVIWLELDKDKKIVRQTDWFNYPMNEIIEAYQLKNSMNIK